MPEYLIIGNSAGGIGAVEAIREVDKDGAITIVSDEPYPAYSRPMISEYLCGERNLEQILYRPSDMYSRNHIDARLGKKVVKLHIDARQAELEGGEKIGWEKLLLATGGTPIVPAMEGMGKRGISTFTTLDDAKAIEALKGQARRAVVIGGGLIGMSVTEALVKLGLEVAVVELMDRVLGALLDEPASRLVETKLLSNGVKLYTDKTVKTIAGRGANDSIVGGVVLSDGQKLDCDLVIVAIGVSPRTQLVKDTLVKLNRGIVVDNHMATNVAGIHACGDVAEAYDYVYRTFRLTPIWPNAYVGGRVAGFNMAGKTTEYRGGTNANSLKYFGLPVVTAGMVNPPSKDGLEIISKAEGDVYKKVILKGGRIQGIVFMGDIQRSGIVFGLMRDGVDVTGFKDKLLSEDFGLSYLPESMRKEKIKAGSR
ncbi:MAG: NAD(P)/FAD-dependent oxidoreductase [Chloroflexi bacterium]|nr:NAD(P)/FAD-dependent oxidoreductase [Chloroflexota bacterium]